MGSKTKLLMHLDNDIKDLVSGNTGSVLVGTTPFTFAAGKFGQGIYFSPATIAPKTMRVDTADCSSITGDFCFEFFLKFLAFGNASTNSNFFRFFLCNSAGATIGQIYASLWTDATGSSGYLTVSIQLGSGGISRGTMNNYPLTVGGDIHVAIERKNGVLSIYTNGVLGRRVDAGDVAGQPLAQIDLSGITAIDIGVSSTQTGQVVLDEVRLSDISIYGDAPFTPPSAPFVLGQRIASSAGKILLSGTKLITYPV